MSNYNEIMLNGEKKNWKLEKFKLKFDQAKKPIVFGKGGSFSKTVMPLVEGRYWPKQDSWNANDKYSTL